MLYVPGSVLGAGGWRDGSMNKILYVRRTHDQEIWTSLKGLPPEPGGGIWELPREDDH